MKRKLILTAVLAAGLSVAAGCGSKSDTADTTATVQETTESVRETTAAKEEKETRETEGVEETAETEGTDYRDGSPWMDSNIDGNVTPDMGEVSLKDDFYLAINKDAILEMEYRPGEIVTSYLNDLDGVVEEKMMKLITEEEADSHELQLIKTYYSLLDDWETRESVAKKRVDQGLELIDSLGTMKDYADVFRDWSKDNLLTDLTSLSLGVASDDSTVWIGALTGPVLTLGDSAEYRERTDQGQLDYEMYKAIYEYVNEQLGFDTAGAAEEFERMIAFEAKIAEHTMTVAECMRAEALEERDNYMTIEELDAILGADYDLKGAMEYNRFVPARILVPEPDQIRCIGDILGDESNLEDIKNYCKVKFLISCADGLSKESMIHVQEIQMEMRGGGEIQDYEKTLLSQVKASLNVPMQMAYVQRYGTAEMKEGIAALCREIAAEYRKMLQEEDWISEETKAEAIRKLDTLTINSLYPDKWDDYSSLDFTGMNLYEANVAISNCTLDIVRSRLNEKIDRDIWDMDVTEVNAYYNPTDNSINIILGIIDDITYSPDMDKEEVYGKIGAVIAHEISHAFDSSGGQFDAEGNMVSWWNEKDLEEFNSRVEKVRAYYDQISIYGDKMLNGASLDGEATADIAGIQCMLRLAARDEDFDYDKMFRAYATLWGGKYIPYAADYLYIYDSHPPYYLRVNATLQQFDEFLETYDIQEEDGMYLAPEDRITVW